MISTSDIVILVVASGALATGIYRWHENTQDVSAITIPASSRTLVEPINNSAEPLLSRDNTLTAANSTQSSGSVKQVVVQTLPETKPITGIVVTSTKQSSESTGVGSHQVRSGDYLGKIAQRYGTDVQTLRNLNGINGTVIQIGQEILYPL